MRVVSRAIPDLCLRIFPVMEQNSTPVKLPHKNPDCIRDPAAHDGALLADLSGHGAELHSRQRKHPSKKGCFAGGTRSESRPEKRVLCSRRIKQNS